MEDFTATNDMRDRFPQSHPKNRQKKPERKRHEVERFATCEKCGKKIIWIRFAGKDFAVDHDPEIHYVRYVSQWGKVSWNVGSGRKSHQECCQGNISKEQEKSK